jgi:hypothetical protein
VPFGKLVVVIPSPATIETVYDNEAVPPPESVACKVKVDEPAVVGVPEIPPPLLSDKPAGRAPPAICQVYGAKPPVAATMALYKVPTLALGRDAVVMARGLVIAIDVCPVACCPEASDT